MPLVVKGIQTAEDARLCAENGCEALVVSNHGGHALQGTAGSIDMLPSIADAVGDRLEVYFDGGVRKGADVLKALALGARATFVGRPISGACPSLARMAWGIASKFCARN